MPDPENEQDDRRPDIQQAVEARSDAAEAAAKDRTLQRAVPLGTGGENGADGVVKNQDLNQQ